MIKILFTIPNFITAGSGAAMLNIVRRLDRREIEPSVCVSKLGGRLDDEVRRLGVPLIEAPFTVPRRPYHSLLSRARSAAAVFEPYRFNIWHSFHYADDYTEPVIARLARARSWVFTKKNMGWNSRAWYLRSLFATRIVAQNSDMMKDFFHARVFRHKTRLIPRGVDTVRFAPSAPSTLGIRRSYASEGQLVVGTVAHVVPVKGLETLIDAAAAVPDAVVVIAGKKLDAPYVAMLEQRIADRGVQQRVHFIGDVVDVPAFLSELDVFCLTTIARGEGCPVSLLEAMAVGRACIATDVPGSRDVIVREQSGLLVPPGDAAALARALQRYADPQLRRRFGGAARDRAVREYSIEREAAAHAALYRELA